MYFFLFDSYRFYVLPYIYIYIYTYINIQVMYDDAKTVQSCLSMQSPNWAHCLGMMCPTSHCGRTHVSDVELVQDAVCILNQSVACRRISSHRRPGDLEQKGPKEQGPMTADSSHNRQQTSVESQVPDFNNVCDLGQETPLSSCYLHYVTYNYRVS